MPTIGVALSGGGERAALYDAAVVNALDGRNASSVSKGLGGILQATTYLSALSGGSWMLASLAINNFPEIYPMVLGGNGSEGWLLEFNLIAPGTTLQSNNYSTALMHDLRNKHVEGFPVTIGDFWGRAIARHFAPGTSRANFYTSTTEADHGASVTWSSVRNLSSYRDFELPFPVITADAYSFSLANLATYDESAIPLQTVVYELSPVEFGSFDPQLAKFLPMENLGTTLVDGQVVSGECVTNYDNAGWVMGASSDLFHALNLTRPEYWRTAVQPVVNLIDHAFNLTQRHQQLDVSAVPNPFFAVTSPNASLSYPDQHETQLRLVDGGLDGEVIPISALGVPARNLDLIIVADGSADTIENTPAGGSIAATVARIALLPSGTYNLPPLPKTTNTFVAQGLNKRPTLFGCNGTAPKLDSQRANASYPLMVYLPNYDPTGTTDTGTFQTAYSSWEMEGFLDAGVAIAGRGIRSSRGEADATWPTCLACAVVERSRGKVGVDRTDECSECFSRYCWSEVEAKTWEGLVKPATTIAKRGTGGKAQSWEVDRAGERHERRLAGGRHRRVVN